MYSNSNEESGLTNSQKQPTGRGIMKAPVEPCMIPSPQQPFVFAVRGLWALASSSFFPCSSLLLPSWRDEQPGGQYWVLMEIKLLEEKSYGDGEVQQSWGREGEWSWRTFLSQLWVGGGILTECLTNKRRHEAISVFLNHTSTSQCSEG